MKHEVIKEPDCLEDPSKEYVKQAMKKIIYQSKTKQFNHYALMIATTIIVSFGFGFGCTIFAHKRMFFAMVCLFAIYIPILSAFLKKLLSVGWDFFVGDKNEK